MYWKESVILKYYLQNVYDTMGVESCDMNDNGGESSGGGFGGSGSGSGYEYGSGYGTAASNEFSKEEEMSKSFDHGIQHHRTTHSTTTCAHNWYRTTFMTKSSSLVVLFVVTIGCVVVVLHNLQLLSSFSPLSLSSSSSMAVGVGVGVRTASLVGGDGDDGSCPNSKYFISSIFNDINFGLYCDELYFEDKATMESKGVDPTSKASHEELSDVQQLLPVIGVLCTERNFPKLMVEYDRNDEINVGACYGKTFDPDDGDCPKSTHYFSSIFTDVNFGAYCDELYYDDRTTMELEVHRRSIQKVGDVQLSPVLGVLCQERNFPVLTAEYDRDEVQSGACYGKTFDPPEKNHAKSSKKGSSKKISSGKSSKKQKTRDYYRVNDISNEYVQ